MSNTKLAIYVVAILIFAICLWEFVADLRITHNLFQTYINQWLNLKVWALTPATVLTTYCFLIEDNVEENK